MRLVWRKWTILLLLLPVVIRELIDACTDVTTYQQNMQLIHKILVYPGGVNAQLPNRAIHSLVVCKAIAGLFVVFHAAMAVLVVFACIAWWIRIKNVLSIAMVVYIVMYMVLFGIVAGDYFLAQVQGIDFTLPVLASALLPGIALFLLRDD